MEVPSGASPGQSLEFTIRCAVTDADFDPPTPAPAPVSTGANTGGAKTADAPGSSPFGFLMMHPNSLSKRHTAILHWSSFAWALIILIILFLSQRNLRLQKFKHKCHPTLRVVVVRQHLVAPSEKVVATNANKGVNSGKQRRLLWSICLGRTCMGCGLLGRVRHPNKNTHTHSRAP